MSIILEFTINNEDFPFGQVLSGAHGAMHFELDRIVPIGDMMMPFIWATGDDHESFVKRLRADQTVQAIHELDRIDDTRLYRIEWAEVPTSLIIDIAQTDAVVLEARGNVHWGFRLRFPNHDKLSAFHTSIIEHEIPIHIERTYTLTEDTERGLLLGLTQDQREALILAFQRGYFETPSEVTLGELAIELGITKQALSTRIRRGNQKVLRRILLGRG